MDRRGPRTCFLVGLGLCVLGFVTLAVNAHVNADGLWYLGFVFLGVAGPGVFMGCLSLGQKYPRLEPVITAFAASMFDSSSIVFLLFQLLYLQAGLGLGTIALVWLSVCLLVSAPTYFTVPTWAFLQNDRAQSGPLPSLPSLPPAAEAAAAGSPQAEGAQAPPAAEGGAPAKLGPGAVWAYMRRPETLMMLAFMSVYNLKSSFYIETFSDQIRQLFDEKTSGHHHRTAAARCRHHTHSCVATRCVPACRRRQLDALFNVSFPVGGLVTSLATSMILQRYPRRPDVYMTVTLVAANLFGLLQLLPLASTQVLAAMLFGPARTFQWACYFHFMTEPSNYPSAVSGRMLGYGNLIIALVGDTFPFLLTRFVDSGTWPARRRSRYGLVHAVLQLLVLGCLGFPLYLRAKQRRREQRRQHV